MTCEPVRALFSELADAMLSADRRAECEAHLAACVDCRREWEGFRRTLSLLNDLERVRAPEGFVDRVLAAAARREPWPRRLLRAVFVPLPVKLPLEVAAIAFVAVGVTYLMPRTPELRQASAPAADTPLLREPASPPVRPEAAVSTRSSDLQSFARPRAKAATHSPVPVESRAEPLEAPVAPAPPSEGKPADSREQPARSEISSAPVAPSAPMRKDLVAEARARGAARETELALARPAMTVSGRLVVQDREAAERAVAALVQHVGGREIARREAGDATRVELEIDRTVWPELTRGLIAIGSWLPDRELGELPLRVRVRVDIAR